LHIRRLRWTLRTSENPLTPKFAEFLFHALLG
jgi:hypothetical protein